MISALVGVTQTFPFHSRHLQSVAECETHAVPFEDAISDKPLRLGNLHRRLAAVCHHKEKLLTFLELILCTRYFFELRLLRSKFE